METILLSLAGMTPQIVTETLWALHRDQGRLPREVHVVTTLAGAEKVRNALLHPAQGQFYRLCRDLGADHRAVRFDASTVHVIGAESGAPREDIRDRADNEATIETLWGVLDGLTRDPAVAVHASLAGGRKTMTFLLGLAMSLFGREQDQLSHVLVSEGFETHGMFFYKPRRPVALETPAGMKLSTADAEIELIDIPFVRLRGRVDPATIHSPGAAGVTEAQARLDGTLLELDMDARTLTCDGTTCRLERAPFAWYCYLLFLHLGGPRFRTAAELSDPALLEQICQKFFHPQGHDLGWIGDSLRNRLDANAPRPFTAPANVPSIVSRLNRSIGDAWATRPALAQWLSVTRRGQNPVRYGIELPPELVRVAKYPGV